MQKWPPLRRASTASSRSGRAGSHRTPWRCVAAPVAGIAMHRGVYGVGHKPTSREARWLAAVLACGEGAVLSHRSAATLWRIRDGEGPYPDVTARYDRRHEEITSHRAVLLEADRDDRFGIPVTSPARTLADLAHVLSLDDLVRAFREAQFLRLYDRKALDRCPEATPVQAPEGTDRGRRHHPVGDGGGASSASASATGSRCRGRSTASARRPTTSPGPSTRLVVETDSWLAHGTPYAFQADRTTSNALQLEGWMILRFTWKDVTKRSRRVAPPHVKDALRARSEPSGPPRRPPRPRPATAAS